MKFDDLFKMVMERSHEIGWKSINEVFGFSKKEKAKKAAQKKLAELNTSMNKMRPTYLTSGKAFES